MIIGTLGVCYFCNLLAKSTVMRGIRGGLGVSQCQRPGRPQEGSGVVTSFLVVAVAVVAVTAVFTVPVVIVRRSSS